MKKGIYRSLATAGIKNNKKLYLPYILTCTGTVAMCYIISFLSMSPVFGSVKGGDTAQMLLGLGFGVMCVFSLIFLFYTNSFLIRRRKKEFGLYNVLGLGKRNLALVLALETLTVAAISVAAGLFCGILFSKMAELLMLKILRSTATYTFSVEPLSIVYTAVLFFAVFTLIFINTLRQIRLTNPIELLRSENTGEKPPRANFAWAILGTAILCAAYFIAVSIKDPLSAVAWFFLASVMVIIATYILFIAGSVTLCRILQKNSKYYYKTNHFVSVSSMVYRMKRNGAGLASICILCTMVLVMISSTVCLYAGAENNLRNLYPRHITMTVNADSPELLTGELSEEIVHTAEKTVSENGAVMENVLDYRFASLGGLLQGNEIVFDSDAYEGRFENYSDIVQVFIVPLSDYNRMTGKNEVLSYGEALICTRDGASCPGDVLRLGDALSLNLKKRADDFVASAPNAVPSFPSVYLFVPDFEAAAQALSEDMYDDGGAGLSFCRCYAFDLDCGDETQIAVRDIISSRISALYAEQEDRWLYVSTSSSAKERGHYYGLYGGLFFLGILLSTVFTFSAVLIIYYKQVSEGYEDRSRFDIMRKVGMTAEEIRKSVNSQMLTVFFLPLIAAGVHLTFAFPLIRKMLLIFGVADLPLLIAATLICYLIFAFFYMLVYRATSKSYLSIVSGLNAAGG